MTPTQSGDILRDKHWALVYFYGCGGMHTPHPKLGHPHGKRCLRNIAAKYRKFYKGPYEHPDR